MDIVRYELNAACATLTIDRPEKRNALNADLVDGLSSALRRAEEDAAARCVVITGTGKAFSAGADLDELRRLQGATPEENEADSQRLADLFAQIYLHPKTVIARINGHALGGGCGLAAVCDLSIATNAARFGFPEVRIGFVPAIVSVFILRKLGDARARALFLRGHVITATQAVEYGLITSAVPESELDAAVDDLTAEIAGETSGSAIGITKRLLGDLQGLNLQDALAHAVDINTAARSTADCRAGVEAFLQKRNPPWKRD